MTIRMPNCVGAIAAAVILYFSASAFASPQNDIPSMPFDQIANSNSGFANFATPTSPPDFGDVATPTTPVEPDVPTTGAGNSAVENSPEPATLTLLGLGGLGAWWRLRSRRAQ